MKARLGETVIRSYPCLAGLSPARKNNMNTNRNDYDDSQTQASDLACAIKPEYKDRSKPTLIQRTPELDMLLVANQNHKAACAEVDKSPVCSETHFGTKALFVRVPKKD